MEVTVYNFVTVFDEVLKIAIYLVRHKNMYEVMKSENSQCVPSSSFGG